jgi:predicted RNA binding protein YcfA (HicA-like mRNA interferase family)
VKRQKLEALLIEHGCVVVRDKGKHTVWENQGGAQATVPRHNEIKKFTARGICKDLGIDPRKVTS